MITLERASSEADLRQIVTLQQKNLLGNISSEEKKNEGFVTVSHTLEILKEMNDVCQHIIAKSDGVVIGYALCMHPKFGEAIEILRPMFEKVKALHPEITNFMPMGQICIDKAYRGQGIFRKLYDAMRESVLPDFDMILTEVDAENLRSLRAHSAIASKICLRTV